MIQDKRILIVETVGPTTKRVGSGYLLGDSLAITARHCLLPPQQAGVGSAPLYRVTWCDGVRRDATLAWPTIADDLANPPDVALLAVDPRPDGIGAAELTIGLDWDHDGSAITVTAVGFPRFKGD